MSEEILLGMTRTPTPPDTLLPDGGYAEVMLCPCGDHLWHKQAVHDHWQKGHFDTPVYCTKEEMMDRIAKARGQHDD